MFKDSGTLQITTLGGTQSALLHLSGEMDTGSASLLLASVEPLLRAGHKHLILDCGELTFCDSQGLRAMKAVADRLSPEGELTIARPSETLSRIINYTSLRECFQMVGRHRSTDPPRYRRWARSIGGATSNRRLVSR